MYVFDKITKVKSGDVELTKKGGSWNRAQVSVQHKGQKMNVRFGWLVESPSSGSWGSIDYHYLLVDVSKKIFGFPRGVFSEKIRVGTDAWTGKELGGGSSGAQNFEECLANEKFFNEIAKDSPIRPFLEAARKEVLTALRRENAKSYDWQRSHIYKTDSEEQEVNRFGFDHISDEHKYKHWTEKQQNRLRGDSLIAKLMDLDEKSRQARVHRKASVAAAKANGKPLSVKEVMALRSEEEKARIPLTKKLLQEKYGRK